MSSYQSGWLALEDTEVKPKLCNVLRREISNGAYEDTTNYDKSLNMYICETIEIDTAAKWTVEEIILWLYRIRKRNPIYEELWDKFFKLLVREKLEAEGTYWEAAGKALRTKEGPDGSNPILDPIEVNFHDRKIRISTAWEALAEIMNLEVPRYQSQIGSEKDYALCILVLLGKWTTELKQCLVKPLIPKKGSYKAPDERRIPIVYSVVYAAIEGSLSRFHLCVGKAVDYAYKDLTSAVLRERRDQMLLPGHFEGHNDNPLSDGILEGNRVPDSTVILKKQVNNNCISNTHETIEKTCKLFCQKYPDGYSRTTNEIGSCAETSGFQFMQGHQNQHFFMITLTHDKIKPIIVGPGYTHSGVKKTKAMCTNCTYISCALEARLGIKLTVFDVIPDTLAVPGASTTQDGHETGNQQGPAPSSKKRERDAKDESNLGNILLGRLKNLRGTRSKE